MTVSDAEFHDLVERIRTEESGEHLGVAWLQCHDENIRGEPVVDYKVSPHGVQQTDEGCWWEEDPETVAYIILYDNPNYTETECAW